MTQDHHEFQFLVPPEGLFLKVPQKQNPFLDFSLSVPTPPVHPWSKNLSLLNSGLTVPGEGPWPAFRAAKFLQ